jgi:hypothetical protein
VEILRKRREELVMDLRKISDNLKIRYDYLKAIEDGELDKLPAEVYTKGYIQEYAKILNITPETIIGAYEQQAAQSQPEKNKIPEREAVPKRKFRLKYGAIPLLSLLLVAIIASLQFRAPREKPVTVSKDKPHTEEVLNTDVPELILEAFATDTTWLLVVIDKANSREVLMQPGDSVTWHAKDCFSLKIGNAGGIRLVFNGKEVGILGETDEVIKINLPGDRI